jgi:hypothetical protein
MTILEEQIATWLRTSNPGKTLDDVADEGNIVEIRDGLLPASLPYTVINTIRHYDSVTLHDAAVPASETKKWGKRLSIDISLPTSITAGKQLMVNAGVSTLLAQLNTKRLTLTTEFPAPGSVPNMVIRWGGTEVARPISGNSTIAGYTPAIGNPYTIIVTMDGAPDASGGVNDNNITANYSAIIGGYYLIATGGESSNWAQVHRAADQLLADNITNKIVFNPADPGINGAACDVVTRMNCTPYVDATGNGWDATDLPLLQNKPALDALTGGLLYVASTQYFASLREQSDRADHLMKAKTPILGFLGVVSSVYDVEYIGNTAFSVLPGGLLIDMKGLANVGSYRANAAPLTYSNRQFEFIGHITSSLEHEIWQELTGYDAVSTVRGIQMAMASGATLLNPKKNATQDTLPGLYPSFGFNTTVPAGFTYTPFTIFATTPATWSHAISGSGFDTLLSTVTTTTNATQRLITSYTYGPTSGLYGWSSCVANQVAAVKANIISTVLPITGTTCFGTPLSGLQGAVLTAISNDWTSNIIPKAIGQTYFNYFDTKQGFTTTGRVFRATPKGVTQYSALSIGTIRENLYSRDLTKSWVEYLMPSTLVTGPNNHFEVDIRKEYDTATGQLYFLSFEILNRGK